MRVGVVRLAAPQCDAHTAPYRTESFELGDRYDGAGDGADRIDARLWSTRWK